MKEKQMLYPNAADVANIYCELNEIILTGEVSGIEFGPGAIAIMLSDLKYADIEIYSVRGSLISHNTTCRLLSAVDQNMASAIHLMETRNIENIGEYGAHFELSDKEIFIGICYLDAGNNTGIQNSRIAQSICNYVLR